ncbi:uroporphyrinogen-III synthase [Phenylobacterium montanum]|uniref:Uroporphyrinogen-III synthase n=1 Tax=Phenylobacterium montanum TaxID=2823693 RepID=A0A975FX18_9CAUL|nr:uroporphyrinogen-III synthase [Caulobacter sp. S6]QUD86990.1 uroporphyrinogen-III synthase [Caulobacter sp. S6]
MTAEPARLWVTRAQPQAAATARRIEALGLMAVVQPVLAVVPIEADLDLSGADALAFTSQAAVAAFAAQSEARALRAFPVGTATAAALRAAGFPRVEAPPPQGDVHGLAKSIATADSRPRLVFNPTAEEPAADLGALLADSGIEVRSTPVYRTVRTHLAAPPEPIDGFLIHSAKAAAAVADVVLPEAAGRLTAYVISEAAAAGLRQRGFGRILLAERPEEASLLELIERDRTRPRKPGDP